MATGSTSTSNPEKLFFPESGLTKQNVVEYYRAVAENMVAHLRDRPLMLRRYPDGIQHEGWFQKEASEHFPDWLRIETVPVHGTGSPVHHVVCDNPETLLYLANQATVEFHVWLSKTGALENPDRLVIDLDPPRGTAVSMLRRVARQVRDRLRALELPVFLQATGGRGFHVVAPLDARSGYGRVRELAAGVAERLAASEPDRLTTEHRKENRGHRIYLDVNRNAYAQTFIAPYSLRARPGAPIATPLDWSELGRATPNGWAPRAMRSRLARKTDPWSSIGAAPGSAERAAELFQSGE
ncbi:non-homologous end-joining DNA ligase [Sciscionella marina]|uniref:non-homologous end-joining DNA ligase n=1 Tax=Sciscionella marina TaxID=508770 RepID=UPI00037F550A|nr:non-homologous end-joining DNA ligase [Sciscionella marina]